MQTILFIVFLSWTSTVPGVPNHTQSFVFESQVSDIPQKNVFCSINSAYFAQGVAKAVEYKGKPADTILTKCQWII